MRSLLGLLLAAVALTVAGCGGGGSQPVSSKNSKFQVEEGPGKPAADAPATDAPPATPPGDAPSSQSPLNEGKPKKLTPPKVAGNPGDGPEALKLMQGLAALAQEQPQGTTEAEMRESVSKILLARTQLATRLLAVPASERTKLGAIEAFIEANLALQEIGDANAMQRVKEFATLASGLAEPGVAQRGRHMLHEIAIVNCIMAKGEGYDEVEKATDMLLKDGKTEGVFAQLQQGVVNFLQEGQMPQAEQTLARIVKEFGDSDNAQIKSELSSLRDLLAVMQSGYDQALLAAFQGEEGGREKLLAKAGELLAKEPRGPVVVSKIQQALSLLEYEDPTSAGKLADELKASFSGHADAKIAQAATDYAESAHKRIALIGKDFDMPVKPHDNAEFDWASYRGKVVLVDFWATWCVPCLQELPNIKAAYDAYHEKGFEVLGVNMDKDRELLARFLSRQPLPWPTLVTPDEGVESPFKSTFAKSIGIEGIPLVILIGKDGKVDSLHVRGERLEKRLAQLLDGEKPVEPTAPEKPAENATSGVEPVRPSLEKPAPPSGDDVPVNTLRTRPIKRTSAEEDVKAETKAEEQSARDSAGTCGAAPAEEQPTNAAENEKVNPYAAKADWSNERLTDYVLKMQEKPKSIRNRNGFSEAMCDACERVLQNKPTEIQSLIAIESKAAILQRWSSFGGPEVEQKTRAFVAEFGEDPRPRAKRAVEVLARELKLADAMQAPVDGIAETLTDFKSYYEGEKLDGRHLKMASNTVALINRLEDGDAREEHFKSFGELFAKSKDKELSRYGKKLAKSKSQSNWVGKEIELTGMDTTGAAFDMKALRGKVVVVDFWATWCGPCKKELPRVEAVYQQHKDRGLEVIGVSLDADADDLAAFLAEHPLPWKTLAGEGNQATAEKYGVRGIPTLMLIDKEGKIRGVAHSIEQLTDTLAKLLER